MEQPILFPRWRVGDVVRLLNARKTAPRQYQAACPAHNDLGEHLAIGTGSSGQLLMRCVEGCRFRAIIAVLDSMKATIEGGAPCQP